jgi:hypothetical protein
MRSEGPWCIVLGGPGNNPGCIWNNNLLSFDPKLSLGYLKHPLCDSDLATCRDPNTIDKLPTPGTLQDDQTDGATFPGLVPCPDTINDS